MRICIGFMCEFYYDLTHGTPLGIGFSATLHGSMR